jgi:DNA-binding transcriptional LysR family regulator
MADDLNAMSVFVTVAEAKGFRAAGERLGVSASAVSQSIAGFLRAHPHVQLDIAVSSEIHDIVASGYDAGIHLGEVIDRDMIAVPITGDLRLVVVGAPTYFARRPKPKHPRELVDHDCINWHLTPEAPPYRWEFTESGREFSVAVPMRVLTTDAVLLIRLARAGVGLTMAFESQLRDELARGELVAVLEEFSTPFPGFYLYYPERRHASPALRAFVDFIRRERAGRRRTRDGNVRKRQRR